MKLNRLELDSLDVACVSAGFFLLVCYHIQLFYRVCKFPSTTVLGTNQRCRKVWITFMTKDPVKQCATAIQVIRNVIVAASILGVATGTLCIIVGGIITHSNSSASVNNPNIGGAPTITASIELFSVLACLLTSFLCNLQTLRYGTYVGFAMSVPLSDDANPGQSPSYVYQSFERSYIFWSLALRSFFCTIPMLMWLFGSIPMLLSCVAMVVVLHFLDTMTRSPNKKSAAAPLESIEFKSMDP